MELNRKVIFLTDSWPKLHFGMEKIRAKKLSECLHFSPRGDRITFFQVNFLVPDFQAIADTEDFTIIVICVKHYK